MSDTQALDKLWKILTTSPHKFPDYGAISEAWAEYEALLRERDEWKARAEILEKELKDTKEMLREPWD